MAKYSQVQISEFPFHITARAHNKQHFPLQLEETWNILTHHLSLVHYKYDLTIHAFVMMPNHFHLIASTYEYELGHIMRAFLCESAKEINSKTRSINQVWGTRYFKCLISSESYYSNVYKYVYQNPVRAKLVSHSEAWPYSTLSGLMGNSKLNLPIQPDEILFNPFFDEKELAWVNQAIPTDLLKTFKTALHKKVLKFPKTKSGDYHPIEFIRF